MKKLICVTNREVAGELAGMGFRYMIQHAAGKEVFAFVESQRLFDVLSDSRKFSKKHWYIDKRLRF